MTLSTSASSSLDLTRLSNCPQCAYSLEGLPAEGTCPECGWAYDRSAVILRCHGPGVLHWNSNVLGIFGAICAIAVLVMVFMFPWSLQHLVQLILMLVFFALFSGMVLLDRATSPRVGDWLLWIAPIGIGVQTEFDPDSLLAQIRRLVTAMFLPVYAASGFAPMIFNGGSAGFIALIATMVFGIAMFWMQRVMLPRPNIAATGARPALFAWNMVNGVKLERGNSGRWRLRAERSSRISRHQQLVYVTFEAADDAVEHIRQRLADWSGMEIKKSGN